MNYTEMLNYVKENVDFKERLVQLAEEATELAQAALKYRRSWDDENPTPVSPYVAFSNLLEEIDDVVLCIETLDVKGDISQRSYRRDRKLIRWVKRLKNASKRVFEES